MNCKKYRACLILLIVFVVAVSFLYYQNSRKDTVPSEGVLVFEDETLEGERDA